jgi:hypothetical protein
MIPPHIGPFEGEAVGVVGMAALGLAFVLLPFLDRRAARGEHSRGFTLAGFLVAGYLAALTCYAWLH